MSEVDLLKGLLPECLPLQKGDFVVVVVVVVVLLRLWDGCFVLPFISLFDTLHLGNYIAG